MYDRLDCWFKRGRTSQEIGYVCMQTYFRFAGKESLQTIYIENVNRIQFYRVYGFMKPR